MANERKLSLKRLESGKIITSFTTYYEILSQIAEDKFLKC